MSKGEVGSWPLIGLIARLGRTVYVSRQRGSTRKERDDMRARLAEGDNLILFPEGTTSDGSRVMPFRSALFAIAEGEDKPLIQPVSVVYDRLAGLPIGRATRPLFAWYGDMDIASHYWRLARHRGLRVSILLHAPLDPDRLRRPEGARAGGVEDRRGWRGNAPAEPPRTADRSHATATRPQPGRTVRSMLDIRQLTCCRHVLSEWRQEFGDHPTDTSS